MQIIEACLVSLITSIISFGLPLLRTCSPCPEGDLDSGIECPRPPGMYGNYVNVRLMLILAPQNMLLQIILQLCVFFSFSFVLTPIMSFFTTVFFTCYCMVMWKMKDQLNPEVACITIPLIMKRGCNYFHQYIFILGPWKHVSGVAIYCIGTF